MDFTLRITKGFTLLLTLGYTLEFTLEVKKWFNNFKQFIYLNFKVKQVPSPVKISLLGLNLFAHLLSFLWTVWLTYVKPILSNMVGRLNYLGLNFNFLSWKSLKKNYLEDNLNFFKNCFKLPLTRPRDVSKQVLLHSCYLTNLIWRRPRNKLFKTT